MKEQIREILIKVAGHNNTISYSEVSKVVGLDMANPGERSKLANTLDEINREEHERGRPLLSAVVVQKESGHPGTGFFDLARELGKQKPDENNQVFFANELKRVFDAWMAAGQDKKNIKKAYEDAKDEIEKLGGWESFKSGEWFLKLIRKCFKNYFERANADYFREKYPSLDVDSIVKKIVKVAARNSAILGTIVGAVVSADELATIFTAGEGGLGLPANITIALMAIAGEAVLLVRMQLQLIANIAKLYNTPLDVDDPEDILTIMAFALGGSVAEVAGKAGMKVGGKITEKAIRKHISRGVLKTIQKLGRKIGIKILQRTIIKYAVPVASMGIGSVWNYVATKTVGRIAVKHFKKRTK